MRFLVLLLTGLAVAVMARSQDRPLAVKDAFAAYTLAAAKVGRDPKRELLDAVPVVVFVPGILGTKLRWGEYVYGVGPIDPKRIVFDRATLPTLEVLDNFDLDLGRTLRRVERVEVYGRSLEEIRTAMAGKFVEEFAYDWRADIDDSARSLQNWLNTKLKGRKVIFLAHSMGGLVVWRWLQLHPKQSRPVTVQKALVVGSPLQGSCEAARMLIANYEAPDNASTLEHAGTYYLFRNAHAALLTFPSVYQLMPAFSTKSPCVFMQGTTGTYAQDHHSADFWFGTPRADSTGLNANSQVMLKAMAATVGLSVEEYERRVRPIFDTSGP